MSDPTDESDDQLIDVDTASVPPGFNLDPIRDGHAGKDGSPGARGPRGVEGARGAPGEDAPKPSFELDGSILRVFVDGEKVGEQDLKGDKGDSLEFQWEGTQLQVRLQGQEEWHTVDLKGEKGDQGERGEKGDRGVMGIMGMRGAKGARGARGLRGAKGDSGARGAQGPKGEKGEKGEKGDPPEHEISGDKTKIRFQNPNGSWGEWIDFKEIMKKAGLGGAGGGGKGGVPGPQGERGPAGPAGAGVPAGGSTGQKLVKASDNSYDTEWVDDEGGSGGINLAETLKVVSLRV